MIECGGSTKTISAISLAVVLALRGYRVLYLDLDANRTGSVVMGYSRDELEGMKSTYDLVMDPKLSIEDVAVPARFLNRAGEREELPNLRLVPASRELSQADTEIALKDRGDWFVDQMHNYSGDDEIIIADFPASYGKLVYSVARMLDEEDSVVPSIRADSKDLKMLPELFKELDRIRDVNAGKRYVPGRPTMRHLILTATPTSSYTEAGARRAAEKAEELYAEFLTPFVRYSATAKAIHESEAPLEVLAPYSRPAEDYRKIATHLGFDDREV
jgi:cellulose biosynthesis protein BcsQ